MADSNSSNAAAQRGFAQDDPFAELTRIMGHDPRIAPQSTQTGDDEATDSLALELENELMGDLMQGDDLAEEAGETPREGAVVWNEAENDAFAQEDTAYALNGARDEHYEDQAARSAADGDTLDSALDDAFASVDDLASFESVVRTEDDEPGEMPVQPHGNPSERSEGGGRDAFDLREEDFAALDADFADLSEDRPPAASDGDQAEDFYTPQEEAAAPEESFVTEIEAHPEPQREEWQAGATQWASAAAASWQPPTDAEPENAPEPAAEETWQQDAAHHVPSGSHRATSSLPPEVETVEVPESTVAVADNLDIPDVPYREEVRPAGEFDEIEEMLAGAFGEADEAPEQPGDAWTAHPSTGHAAWEDREEGVEDELAAGLTNAMAAGQEDLRRGEEPGGYGLDDKDWNGAFDEPEPLAPSPGVEPPARANSRFGSRAVAAAAVIGGIAVLGGVAVFALNFGGEEPAGPVIVRADDTPVKVKPENPGGTTIPNQDNQVYKRVAGEEADAQPPQTRLVSRTEEPIDLPSPVEEASAPAEDLPGVQEPTVEAAKIEERLENPIEETASAESETAALAPRRVRSFVVRPDGSMVPNDLPEPELPANTEAASAPDQPTMVEETPEPALAGTGEPAETPQVPGTDAQAAAALASGVEEGVGEEPARAGTEIAGETEDTSVAAAMPSQAPIPPSRPATVPSAQPQQQAETPEPAQVAAAQPQPAQPQAAQPQSAQPQAAQPAAGSEWSVQIASQPSLEGAQRSYQELAQRYGSMLQGRGVNIVKAEIDGRGTYFRVRVPSTSKDEAIRLCTQLKSAGGSCFVSK